MTSSNRRDRRGIVTIERKIHSIKINQKLVGGIVKILENAYEEIVNQNKGETCTISYTIIDKNGREKYETPDEILDKDLTKFNTLDFYLYSNSKKILVTLHNTIYTNSGFIVEWNNSTLAHGKAGELDRLLKDYKTPNDFFHFRKRWFLYVSVGLTLGIIAALGNKDEFGKVVYFLAWTITVPIYLNFIFGWLYPKNETEYSKQVRFRKAIGSAVVTIILGLIVTLIWQLIIR